MRPYEALSFLHLDMLTEVAVLVVLPVCVCLHTSPYVSIRSTCCASRLRLPAYVSICQHTQYLLRFPSASASIRQHTQYLLRFPSASAARREATRAYVSPRQHT